MVGTQVTGKRLGIIGMGKVGQVMARRGRGFDMEIHYCNRTRLDADLEEDAVFHPDPEEMLGVVDVFSLNCPATAQTTHWLNSERIARLRKGAIVVNSARGNVVDDDALIAALQSGHLASAGLDVFEGEPNLDPRYLELDNVFLLPHMGSATVETRNAMGFRCLDNLDAHFAGQDLPSRIG